MLGLTSVVKMVLYRSINSKITWSKHTIWSRILYAPLPLKLYIAQLIGMGWEKVEGGVGGWCRDRMVEWEAEEIEKGFLFTLGGEDEEEDEEEEEYYDTETDVE